MKPSTCALIWLVLIAVFLTNAEAQGLFSSLLGAVLRIPRTATPTAAPDVPTPTREPLLVTLSPSAVENASHSPVAVVPQRRQPEETLRPAIATQPPAASPPPVHNMQPVQPPASPPSPPPPPSELTSPSPPSMSPSSTPATQSPPSSSSRLQRPREPAAASTATTSTPQVSVTPEPSLLSSTVADAPTQKPVADGNSLTSPPSVGSSTIEAPQTPTRSPVATVASSSPSTDNSTDDAPLAPTRSPSATISPISSVNSTTLYRPSGHSTGEGSVAPAGAPTSTDSTANSPSSGNTTTAVPQASTRNQTAAANATKKPEPVASLPVVTTQIPTNISTGSSNATAQVALAPTRVSKNSSAAPKASTSDSSKCGEQEYKRMYQYYVTNKQIQDDCTKATSGYTFPFSGKPSRDQIAAMTKSGACIILLKGISQVLTTECVLGDMPVKTTAAKILSAGAQLQEGASGSAASDAGVQVASEATLPESPGPLGTISSGSAETATPTATKANHVKLSKDLEIVDGWQYAPVRDQQATVAAVHSDVMVSAVLPSEVNANLPDNSDRLSSENPAKTNVAASNVSVKTLADAMTSSAARITLARTSAVTATVISVSFLFV